MVIALSAWSNPQNIKTPNPKKQIYMKTTKLILSAAMTIGLFQGISSVEAAQMTGSIDFDGGVVLDTGVVGTATAVTTWTGAGGVGLPTVVANSLSPGGSPGGSTVTISAPWSFVSGAIASFWSTGGYTFDLTSSSIAFQTGTFINASGPGILKHAGFDDTPGTWAFSTQSPGSGSPTVFSFSAATGTPVSDVGGTASLMGMGLMGLALVRRKVQAIRAGEGTVG